MDSGNLILYGGLALGAYVLLSGGLTGVGKDVGGGVSSFIQEVGTGVTQTGVAISDTITFGSNTGPGKALGQTCTRTSDCSQDGIAYAATDPNLVRGRLNSPIGCCRNKCNFRRVNHEGNMRCFHNCRSCPLCKFGSQSSKPCKASTAEKKWLRDNASTTTPITAAGSTDVIGMSITTHGGSLGEPFASVDLPNPGGALFKPFEAVNHALSADKRRNSRNKVSGYGRN